MGGDHKCPVCSATFTRPQHVVRHMRSHTGDRPYKCQHCGDQFSRSDLLSRHINKCHVGEKVQGGTMSHESHGRRKGLSANATRATTSKQACDQCVQSSLPCDGCNPCAKCVQRKIRCTFVKFHRQTAPIGPGHNQSHSSNSSSSPSHHPSPPQQQAPAFNPAAGNTYGPVYGSYDSFVGSLSYPTHNGSEDDPFVLHPAPGSSSYAANYRAQQSELHRRASLPSFSATGQPWISGWHENTENGEGGTVPFNVDAQNHFAFNVGGDYTDQSFTLRHPHAQHSHQPPYLHHTQHHSNHSHPHPHASSTTSVNSFSSSSSSHDSRPGTASDISSVAEDPPSRPGTSSSYAESLSGSRPGTSASGSMDEHPSEHSNNAGFSNAFGLLSLDDPAVIAGLANDGAPFFSHLNHLGVDSHLNNPPGSTGMPLDATSTVGTGLALRNDPDATPMPIGEAQAMGLVGPGVVPNPTISSTSSHQPQHFPRGRPSTGHGRNSNWGPGNTGDLGTPGRETETRELREFWKAYMRTPLSGPGGTAGGMLGAHPDMHLLSPGGNLNGNSSSGAAASPYRRQRISSLPSVKTPTAISDEERYAAGFVGFNGPYGQKYPQPQGPPPLLVPPSHRNHPGHASYQQPHNVPYAVAPGGAATIHGNAEDLRSYEAAVLARKAPVNLSMEGLGGKMRRKATNDNNARMISASANVSPNLSFATQSQGSGSSPSSASSADSSPAIPQSLPHESALHIEGGESAARRPSFKRGASQVLEKGGSGKLARRTSSSRYDSLEHEYDYGEHTSLLTPFEANAAIVNLINSSMSVFGVEADKFAGVGGLQATASS